MSGNRNDPGAGSPPRYPGSFILAFREAAASLNLTPVKWLGDGAVVRTAEGKESTVGFENLFRRCRQQDDRGRWVEVIRDFLRNLAPGKEEEEAPEDLNPVADRVLPRLGRPINDPEIVSRIWWKRLDPERVWLNLVIDYPTRMMYVTQELVEKSGHPGEYWLGKALDNLRARSTPEMAPVVSQETGIRVISTEDSYDAPRAMILDTLIPESEATGCFVAPVSREQVVVLPVTMDSLVHVHILKRLARDNYPKVPYPISDEVYWVRGGEWHLFPIEITEEGITVRPPEEFIEVLNTLSPSEEGGGEGEAETEGQAGEGGDGI